MVQPLFSSVWGPHSGGVSGASVGRGASVRLGWGRGLSRVAAGRSRPNGNRATPLTGSPSPAAAGPPPASPARLLPLYLPRQSRQSELPGDASPLTPSEGRGPDGTPLQRGFCPTAGTRACRRGWRGGRCLSAGRFAGRPRAAVRDRNLPATVNSVRENCHRDGVTEEGFPVVCVENDFADLVLSL